MRTLIWWIVGIGLLLIGGASWLLAAPTIGSTNATPTLINVGIPATITVTSVITDAALISTSVNLLRLFPNGTTAILGQLHDDGKNGDQIAGDKTFAVQVTLNEAAEGQVKLQVSAAFRGVLTRARSSIVAIPVSLPGLPPDPGDAGKATLEGIDSDHDGVRDDVQRWIAINYSDSAKMRSGLTQFAKAAEVTVMGTDPTQAGANMGSVLRAQYCVGTIEYSLLHRSDYGYKAALSQLLNTYARARAFEKADYESSGHMFGIPQVGHELETCDVNPLSLPN